MIPRRYLLLWSKGPKNNRASLIQILKTKVPGIPWVLAILNGHVGSPEWYNHP